MKYIGLFLLALTALLSGCSTKMHNGQEYIGSYYEKSGNGQMYKYRVYVDPRLSEGQKQKIYKWSRENIDIDSVYNPPPLENLN